jgi:hypothetical protein
VQDARGLLDCRTGGEETEQPALLQPEGGSGRPVLDRRIDGESRGVHAVPRTELQARGPDEGDDRDLRDAELQGDRPRPPPVPDELEDLVFAAGEHLPKGYAGWREMWIVSRRVRPQTSGWQAGRRAAAAYAVAAAANTPHLGVVPHRLFISG